MDHLCSVYWIHLSSHTDITSEGYIGVTTRDVEERFSEHKSSAKLGSTVTLSNAIRKYGDRLIISVLLKGDESYCLLMESKLRPEARVGWNVVAGGGKPPKHTKHTEETKAKISASLKKRGITEDMRVYYESRRGYFHSEEAKSKMSDKAKSLHPWERSKANKDVWSVADEVYQLHLSNPDFGAIKLEKLLGFSKYSLTTIYTKFTKQNWNPLTDSAWTEWSKTHKENLKGIQK